MESTEQIISKIFKEFINIPLDQILPTHMMTVETAMKSCRKAIEQSHRWIPIEEEMPAIDSPKMLIKYNDGTTSMSFRREIGFMNFRSDLSYITHWKPIN